MTTVLKQNRVFFLTLTLLLLLTGILQLFYTQTELMQWVNSHYHPAADAFFRNVTHLGDGAFFALVALILAFRAFRYAVLALSSFALSSLTAQGLKHFAFPNALRPLAYFEQTTWPYRLIEGLDIHRFNSFPSGHSTSAFAVFTLLALLDERKGRGWFFVLLAAITAYSRVYLFQHFVEDVFAGALIGTASSLVVYGLLDNRWERRPADWHKRRFRLKKPQPAK